MNQPEEITIEPLSGDSFIRCQEIDNTNELTHKYSLSELQYKAWSPFFKDLKRPNQI